MENVQYLLLFRPRSIAPRGVLFLYLFAETYNKSVVPQAGAAKTVVVGTATVCETTRGMLFETRTGEAATNVVAGAAKTVDEPSKRAILKLIEFWIVLILFQIL